MKLDCIQISNKNLHGVKNNNNGKNYFIFQPAWLISMKI